MIANHMGRRNELENDFRIQEWGRSMSKTEHTDVQMIAELKQLFTGFPCRNRCATP